VIRFQEKDRCNRRLQPKTTFSRLPPLHRADQECLLRVDLTRSVSRPFAECDGGLSLRLCECSFAKPPAIQLEISPH
jgi:hypothetical protein